MSISHDGFAFGGSNMIHGLLVTGDPEVPAQVQRVAGLSGESHLVDRPKGRPFHTTIWLGGYASWSECMAAIDSIHEKQKQLTGALQITNHPQINRMTFWKCETISGPRWDASGVHGYFARMRLIWIQRSI